MVVKASTQRVPRAPLTQSQGFLVVLIAVGGFVVGEIVGTVTTVVGASLANYHGSLSSLAALSEPPWWTIVAGLIGIWIGFLVGVGVAQRAASVVDFGSAYRVRVTDVWYIVLGVTLQVAISAAYSPFNQQNVSAPANKLLGSASGWTYALIGVMTIVGAPLVEELFFRGVLLRGLVGAFSTMKRNIGVTLAVVVDGVLFGLAHGELLQLAGLAAVGVVLSVVYLRTQRLVPCVLAHGAFNAVAVLSLFSQRAH